MGPTDFPAALAAARAGDEAGVSWLWRRWNPALLRFLRARNAPAADDVAATVWMEVARALHRFEGDEDDFPRWLFTIARRRNIDELRRANARPELLAGEVPPTLDQAADTADVADAREGTDWAIRLVRRLAPDQADAVLLRVVAGLDVARTAAVMGKTPGAVRVLTHRGLRRLAELIEADGGTRRTVVDDVTGFAGGPLEGLE